MKGRVLVNINTVKLLITNIRPEYVKYIKPDMTMWTTYSLTVLMEINSEINRFPTHHYHPYRRIVPPTRSFSHQKHQQNKA